jgi:hypothetical protein
MFPPGVGGGGDDCGGVGAVCGVLIRFVGAVDADAFAAAALSLTFYALPHFLGDAEALAAPSLVARARIGTGERFVAYGAGRGLSSVASSLVKVTGEVARGAEL